MQKKNQAEVRRLGNAYLSFVVLGQQDTNSARVFELGLDSGNGRIIPIAKSDPQRKVTAENGEIIRVSIKGLSRRQDGGVTKWGIVSPMPVKAKIAPSRPSKISDLERLWSDEK